MWCVRILLGISNVFFCAFWLPRQNTFAGFVCPSKTPCCFLFHFCLFVVLHWCTTAVCKLLHLGISVILCIIYKSSDIFNNKISLFNNRILLYLTFIFKKNILAYLPSSHLPFIFKPWNSYLKGLHVVKVVFHCIFGLLLEECINEFAS